MKKGLLALGLALSTLLAGCSSVKTGHFYQNDGPPTLARKGQAATQIPKIEPFRTATLRPYTVLGKRYVPLNGDLPYQKRGTASWYGKQFHNKKTATGERYDMHELTAAHPTMPLPSYAEVTNLDNGKKVIVRVNDRGPFLHGRLIDLSYEAARQLGYADKGTARVEVKRLTFADIRALREKSDRREPVAEPQPLTAPEAIPLKAYVIETPVVAENIPEQVPVGTVPVAPVTVQPQAPVLDNEIVAVTPTPVSSPFNVALPSGPYSVQLGAFTDRERAADFLAHTQAVLASQDVKLGVRLIERQGVFKIVTDKTTTPEAARALVKPLNVLLGIQAFITRL